MGRLIDETGNKYGRLTVLYRANNDGKIVKWHCLCDCGQELDVAGSSLRSGNTKSCGCLQKDKAIESNIKRGRPIKIGDVFGELTVIEQLPSKIAKNGKKQRYFLTQCSCGEQISISGQELLRKSEHRCMKCNNKLTSKRTIIREEGNKYGRLTVIEEAGRDKDNRVLWRCHCDCGNEKIALGKSLRAGLVLSCGCLHSKGESKIAILLTEMGINFIQQYHTDKLKSENNHFLYFDFYLPEYNTIIEYQGEQHYQNIHSWYDDEGFQQLLQRDEQKRIFCKDNQIKLVEIPYTDYKILDEEYIRRVIK